MSDQEIIDEIMDFLDFEKIHKTMEALNWYWADVDGIPEIYEIRHFLRKLLKEFLDENLSESSCGGFRIWKSQNTVNISFEITSLEVYDKDRLL